MSFQAHPVGESINKIKLLSSSSSSSRSEGGDPLLLTCSDDKTVRIWKAIEDQQEKNATEKEEREKKKEREGKKEKKRKKERKKKNVDSDAGGGEQGQAPLQCVRVMRHDSYVFCLDSDGNRIVSGDFAEK